MIAYNCTYISTRLFYLLFALFILASADVKSDILLSIQQEGDDVVVAISGELQDLGWPPGNSSTMTVSQFGAGNSKINLVFARGMLATASWKISLLNDTTGAAGVWQGDFFAHADSTELVSGDIDAFMFTGKPTDNGMWVEDPHITLADYSWGSQISGQIKFRDKTLSDLGIRSFGAMEYEILPAEGGVDGQKLTVSIVEP